MKCSEFVLCSSDLNTDTRPGNVRYPKSLIRSCSRLLRVTRFELTLFAASRQF